MNNTIINGKSNKKAAKEKRAGRLKKSILTSALSFGVVIASNQNGLCMESKVSNTLKLQSHPKFNKKVDIVKSMENFNRKYRIDNEQGKYKYTGNLYSNGKIDDKTQKIIEDFLNIMKNAKSLANKYMFFNYHTAWTSYIAETGDKQEKSFNRYFEIFAQVIKIEKRKADNMINLYHVSKAGKIPGDKVSFRNDKICSIYQAGTSFNNFYTDPDFDNVSDENCPYQFFKGEITEVYYAQVSENDYNNPDSDFRSIFFVPKSDVQRGEFSHVRLKHSYLNNSDIIIHNKNDKYKFIELLMLDKNTSLGILNHYPIRNIFSKNFDSDTKEESLTSNIKKQAKGVDDLDSDTEEEYLTSNIKKQSEVVDDRKSDTD